MESAMRPAYVCPKGTFENFVTMAFADGIMFQVRKGDLVANGAGGYRLDNCAYLHVFPGRQVTPAPDDEPNHPEGTMVEVGDLVVEQVRVRHREKCAGEDAAHKQAA